MTVAELIEKLKAMPQEAEAATRDDSNVWPIKNVRLLGSDEAWFYREDLRGPFPKQAKVVLMD